jgi:putative endonuclease
MPCHVYILFSPSLNRHYVGITNDPNRRLGQHLGGKTRATAKVKDWKTVWSTTGSDHAAARELEKQIKARGARRFLSNQGCA